MKQSMSISRIKGIGETPDDEKDDRNELGWRRVVMVVLRERSQKGYDMFARLHLNEKEAFSELLRQESVYICCRIALYVESTDRSLYMDKTIRKGYRTITRAQHDGEI